jgi:hypothetical protein
VHRAKNIIHLKAHCRSDFVTVLSELLQKLSAVVLLWGMSLASWLLAIDEHSGLEGLRVLTALA